MVNYSQFYLLQNPPKMVKDFDVWKYVVNKMTSNGTKEIKISGVIRYYQTKLNFLKNKQ